MASTIPDSSLENLLRSGVRCVEISGRLPEDREAGGLSGELKRYLSMSTASDLPANGYSFFAKANIVKRYSVVSLRSTSFRSSYRPALGEIEKLPLEELENRFGTIKHPAFEMVAAA